MNMTSRSMTMRAALIIQLLRTFKVFVSLAVFSWPSQTIAQAASVENLRASQQAYVCVKENFKKWMGVDIESVTTLEGRNTAIANASLIFSFIEREGDNDASWLVVWGHLNEVYGNDPDRIINGRNYVVDYMYECYFYAFTPYFK